MTIAQEVIETLRPLSIAACTLQYGYAMPHSGPRVTFPPYRRVLSERRAKDGRCLMLLCEYSDGSRLRFTYSQQTGITQYRDATPRKMERVA